MKLHVVVVLIAITLTKEGPMYVTLSADGIVFSDEGEFWKLMPPMTFGLNTMYLYVSAHHCPKVHQPY